MCSSDLLSATAEKNIELGWNLNMRSLSYVLDLAKEGIIKKIYWPSSIAVFGPTTPKINTPQFTVMEPNTVYGISKQAGERWCEYYYNKFNVDVRSLRYPGLISWKAAPGGGTTDYAVDIFHHAIKHGKYESFLSEDGTRLNSSHKPISYAVFCLKKKKTNETQTNTFEKPTRDDCYIHS